jgi:hypothetical protein
MRKKGFLVILFSLFAAVVLSQHLSHQVLVSAAGVASPKGIGYSQTIGEAVVEVIGDYDHVLTQGFQQPKLKITIGEKPPGTGVKAYPNPVTDYITVEFFGETAREFSIKIFNLNGTLLFMDEAVYDGSYWEKRRIPVLNLMSGFYILRVESSDRQINRSFKMEKL